MDLKKLLCAVALVLVAVIFALPIASLASDQANHTATYASIDDKVSTVLKLTATSTVVSAGISAIPGDTATPIANKLADFTEYFLLILCVLYAEKYLLTILGLAAFRFLVPLACLLGIWALYRNSPVVRQLSIKLVLFALAIFFAVPVSIRVSDMIYATFQQSIETTITDAEEFSVRTEGLTEAGEDKGIIASILSGLKETTATLTDRASAIMNGFVESMAVMIVTSCIIPLLVLLFFLWVIKLLTGIDIPLAPPQRHRDCKHTVSAES